MEKGFLWLIAPFKFYSVLWKVIIYFWQPAIHSAVVLYFTNCTLLLKATFVCGNPPEISATYFFVIIIIAQIV